MFMHMLMPVGELIVGSELRPWQHPSSDANPEEIVRHFELRQALQMVLETITPRERDILIMHFYEDLSLEEISRKFKVTRKYIRRLELKALRDLRDSSCSEELQNFL